MERFRTKEELDRAKWADKYLSVAEGKQYVVDARGSSEHSPFPIHPYFRNKLLGSAVRMLEVNAGQALIEHMVADTLTDMSIEIGDEEEGEDADEQEIREWMDSIEYHDKLEEAVRDMYSAGYGAQQPIRDEDGMVYVGNVEPSTWYPTIPTFTWQPVTEGKTICVFDEGKDGVQDWYAFVEKHAPGTIDYQLIKLENQWSLDGNVVPLTKLERFAGLEAGETKLDELAVFTINRKKTSRMLLGQSALAPIWDILQEVSQLQTHIRHEVIKHSKAKLFGPIKAFQRAENVHEEAISSTQNSKQVATQRGAFFDLNQEIFPVPPGEQPPGYILRDLQFIEKGSAEIDKLLSRAAGIVGCPKSVFNLEDNAGNTHVETEKRKDRRYVRQILQGQRQAEKLVRNTIRARWKWTSKEEKPVTVKLANPFDMTQEEVTALMREMNPGAHFVSQKRAVKEIWKGMKPTERDELLDEIEEEQQLTEPPPGSALNNIPSVEL
jgi:hypothetical protein